jgi:hypothetical protein
LSWTKILDILLNYGPLGIAFYIFLSTQSKREERHQEIQSQKESQHQQIYQQLLDTVINNNDKAISKLESSLIKLSETLEKQSRFYDMSLSDISVSILRIKESCAVNCGQILTSLYDERGLSKSIYKDRVEDIIIKKVYQSVIDISTTIDANGFDTESAISLLKENIKRTLDKRHNEIYAELEKLEYDMEKKIEINDTIEATYKDFCQKLTDKVFDSLNPEFLDEDKNYKKFKSIFKNIVFSYLDDLMKNTSNILR